MSMGFTLVTGLRGSRAGHPPLYLTDRVQVPDRAPLVLVFCRGLGGRHLGFDLLPWCGAAAAWRVALFLVMDWHPVGAHLASPSWAESFPAGFLQGPPVWSRDSPEHLASPACLLLPAVRWRWVGCGRGQISNSKNVASGSSLSFLRAPWEMKLSLAQLAKVYEVMR